MKTQISSKAFCLTILFVMALVGVLYRVVERAEHEKYRNRQVVYPVASAAERRITHNGRLEYLLTNNPQ